MKCAWNGKIFSEQPGAAERMFHLVCAPIAHIDDSLRSKMCAALELALIDIKARVHPGGFIHLAKDTVKDILLRKAGGLAKAGIGCFVFDSTALYDVPKISDPINGTVSRDGITFTNQNGDTIMDIRPGDRILAVRGRIDISFLETFSFDDSISPGLAMAAGAAFGFGFGAAVMTGGLTPNKQTQKTDKFGAIEIYNISKQTSIRIIEGVFNFRNLFGTATEFSFIANERSLVNVLADISSNTVIDNDYERSSLPHINTGMNRTTGNIHGIGAKKNTVEKDGLGRFSFYSRFRYIVEAYAKPRA